MEVESSTLPATPPFKYRAVIEVAFWKNRPLSMHQLTNLDVADPTGYSGRPQDGTLRKSSWGERIPLTFQGPSFLETA